MVLTATPVKQDARITLRLRNRLGIPTSLHPHGIRTANASDGTLEVRDAIADADSFRADFAGLDTLSAHPMPHTIHFHGQRFLVHTVNGVPNTELAWKDTYRVE